MALWVKLVHIIAMTAEKVGQTDPLNTSAACKTHIYSLCWKSEPLDLESQIMHALIAQEYNKPNSHFIKVSCCPSAISKGCNIPQFSLL